MYRARTLPLPLPRRIAPTDRIHLRRSICYGIIICPRRRRVRLSRKRGRVAIGSRMVRGVILCARSGLVERIMLLSWRELAVVARRLLVSCHLGRSVPLASTLQWGVGPCFPDVGSSTSNEPSPKMVCSVDVEVGAPARIQQWSLQEDERFRLGGCRSR